MKSSKTPNQENSLEQPSVQMTEIEAGVDLKDKIDFLFKIIGRFDFYINSTNTKGSLILAWNGLLIGSLIIKYDTILLLYPDQSRFRLIASALLFLSALCAVISNIVALRVVFPFLQSSSQFLEPKSLIFYGSVARFTTEDYSEKIRGSSKAGLVEDLCDQAVTLAKGLHHKMMMLQKSIIAVYCELFFILFLVVAKLIVTFI